MAAILQICKLTMFLGSYDGRFFSETQHDQLKKLKQKNDLLEFFWSSAINIDRILTRLR